MKLREFVASSQQLCIVRNGKGNSLGEREIMPDINSYHQQGKKCIINGKYVRKL